LSFIKKELEKIRERYMVGLREKKRSSEMTVERNTEECRGLYQRIDFWIKPILERFGETEWGKGQCVIDLKPTEPSGTEEGGWVVRRLAGDAHYQVGIDTFQNGEMKKCRFWIKTGGRSVFSEDLTEEGLREVLNKALDFGPTHPAPPGKIRK